MMGLWQLSRGLWQMSRNLWQLGQSFLPLGRGLSWAGALNAFGVECRGSGSWAGALNAGRRAAVMAADCHGKKVIKSRDVGQGC